MNVAEISVSHIVVNMI